MHPTNITDLMDISPEYEDFHHFQSIKWGSAKQFDLDESKQRCSRRPSAVALAGPHSLRPGDAVCLAKWTGAKMGYKEQKIRKFHGILGDGNGFR